MRIITSAPLCALVLVTCLSAQQAPSPKSEPQSATSTPARSAPAKTARGSKASTASTEKVDSVQQRGLQMLQVAEADAGALQGGTAAFALLQVARAYGKSDKPHAIELLHRALAATRSVDNDEYDGLGQRSRLQWYILRELINYSPRQVDEFLPEIEPDARQRVLDSLLVYYESHKQLDRAIEMLYRIAAQNEMPYDTALRLMRLLPPSKGSELLQIFTTALGSYRDHREHAPVGDFSALIVNFRTQLPPATVREAIDEVFAQAEQLLKDGVRITSGLGTPQGAITFHSLYEMRLFQLLPTLKELDPAAADKLLRDHPSVAAMLEKYPLGIESLRLPNASDAPPADKGRRAVWKIRGTHDTLSSRMTEFSKGLKIAAGAAEHPSDALANVNSITDATMRCYALDGIARAALTKDRSTAKSATQQLTDCITSAEGLDIQLMLLRSAIDLYLRLHDDDSAKSTLTRGVVLAEKAYKQDSDAEEPNRAIKAFWPSTAAYRWFCSEAAELSPALAAEISAQISDPELRVMGEIAVAQAWLKLPEGTTPVITARKSRADVLTIE